MVQEIAQSIIPRMASSAEAQDIYFCSSERQTISLF